MANYDNVTRAPWAKNTTATQGAQLPNVTAFPLRRPQQQQPKSHPIPQDPYEPYKRISDEEGLQQWIHSEAHRILFDFVLQLNEVVCSKQIPKSIDEDSVSPTIRRCLDVLKTLNGWLKDFPAIQQPTRYGNKAFRQWYERLLAEAKPLMCKIANVPDYASGTEEQKRLITELATYFQDSFGNATRIDYGTGHETTFAAWMCCLELAHWTTPEDRLGLVSIVFPAYIEVMRNIQRQYKLEPAGSHGVWGLDDYQFLIFLWGASQLIGQDEITPSSIHDPMVIETYHREYMYLAGIRAIKEFKSGPFGEHSPILNDISAVQTWSKVNSGLIKMYLAEVLHKLPVIQHFLFGTLLPFVPAKQPAEASGTAPSE